MEHKEEMSEDAPVNESVKEEANGTTETSLLNEEKRTQSPSFRRKTTDQVQMMTKRPTSSPFRRPEKKGLTAKQKEKKDNKLRYLKYDLDLWHRTTCHILDTSTEVGSRGNDLAKEIINRLITRKPIDKVIRKLDSHPEILENPDLLIRLQKENKFLIKELQKERENKTVLSCNQCETLKFHLIRYKSERDESKTKNENLCNAVKCLRDRNDRLLDELDQYKEEINVEGQKTNKDFAEQVRDAKASILHYKNEAERNKERCEKDKQTICLLKNEKEELENILQKINVDKQREQKNIQWFEQQRKELINENCELQRKILQLENSYAAEQEKCKKFEIKLQSIISVLRETEIVYHAEKKDWVKRIQELQMSLRSIQVPDETSLMTIEYQKIEIEKKNKELAELKCKMHSFEKELENEKARNSKMLSDQRMEMDILNHDKINIKKQLDHALQNLIHFKKQDAEKKTASQEDILRLEDLNEDKILLRNKLYSLEEEKRELQDSNVQYKSDLHLKDRKVDELTAELEGLQQQCKVLSQILEGIKKEKTDMENQLELHSSKRGEIISLKRKVNSLLSENGDLKQRCRHQDELQQKTNTEIRNLKGTIGQLETNLISMKQEKETLSVKLEPERVEKAELEERTMRRSSLETDPKNCQNCWKHRNEISELRSVHCTQYTILAESCRLEEAAGNSLRDNNLNIADLSDRNRPTSLAEKFNSLYTDEYTDAMEVVDGEMEEEEAVNLLLKWLKTSYKWCATLAREQRDLFIRESVGFISKYDEHNGRGQFVLTDRCHIYAKEFQRQIATDTLPAVQQICQIKSVTQDKLRRNEYIVKYIKRCTELFWMMQITDPPLHVNFDVKQGERLEKDLYNVFSKSGSKIRCLAWPVLYLHEGGPLLAKGVVQGM